MKPTPKSQPKTASLLAFGAHPDDIEFACGGVIASETQAGRRAHFVVCSRGEAGTNGSPRVRIAEAKAAARLLGATVEFVELDGDAHLEIRSAHVIRLAGILRRVRPAMVLAPSVEENQHPDHAKLGKMVRDAARLARYGGLKELRRSPPHTIAHLLFYAVTPEAEPRHLSPILINVSDPRIVAAWTAAMSAHQSQTATRDYVGLQLARARLLGTRAGVGHAVALFPNDPIVLDSLAALNRSARHF
jgi:N-acetylglucosamine malate deacetylase 1